MNVQHEGSRVLVVDDNPANIDILLELLHAYDVRAVLSGESALEAVHEELPELILLDISLPGIDGFEVCRRLKASSRTKDIPVIFLSASTDDASITKGFEIGGIDYVTKPYRAKEVLARVKTHLQLYHALQNLKKIAMTDELTGIANRRKFNMRAQRQVEQAKAKNIPLFLFLVSLDDFKEINDNYGRHVGDRFIQGFVEAARELLPPNSCFARLGSIEFVIMLSGNQTKILKQMEMLRAMVEKIRPVRGKPISVSVSIGMTNLKAPEDTLERMLKRADIAVSEAKESGGNTIKANI